MSQPEVKFDVNDIKEKIKIITEKVNELRTQNLSNIDIESHFFNNEEEMYQKYPYLIKKIIKNDNLEFLDKMVLNLQSVETGDQSFASTELKLGKELADEYLPKNN
jgi:predicted nucleotidyltransferase